MDKAARQYLEIDLDVMPRGNHRERAHIDVLDIAGVHADDRHCLRGEGDVDGVRGGPHERPAGTLLKGCEGRALDPVDGFTDSAERGQVVDPAQQGVDDQHDHDQGHGEQHDSALRAVSTGTQRDDADQTEQERSNERRKGVLGGWVVESSITRVVARGVTPLLAAL